MTLSRSEVSTIQERWPRTAKMDAAAFIAGMHALSAAYTTPLDFDNYRVFMLVVAEKLTGEEWTTAVRWICENQTTPKMPPPGKLLEVADMLRRPVATKCEDCDSTGFVEIEDKFRPSYRFVARCRRCKR